MSIKVFCNLCGKEIASSGFFCEVVVKERVSSVDPGQAGRQQIQVRERTFHLCRDCFDKTLRGLK